jgi:RND superfamily putative drug exporter
MGLTAAGTVAVAVLIALTLVPAVLGFAGERLRPRPVRERPGTPGRRPAWLLRLRPSRPWAERRGHWGLAWAQLIQRAPALVLVFGIAVLAVLALPATGLRLGLPGNESEPASSTQHQSYDLLDQGFGPGFNATLAVVVDARGIPGPARAGVLKSLTAALSRDPGVAGVSPPVASPAGPITVLSVTPKTGPDAQATTGLVNRMRADDVPLVDRAGGTGYVAGNTAANIDVSAKLESALPLFVAIIVVVAFILLTVAFRSLLVPLTAVIGFLLSVAASLGVMVWFFQDGNLTGISGAAAAAVTAGVQSSGRVVCAAALIMTSVFGGFIPTGDPIIKSIAFSLTAGVLVDAFVVRMTLIPAVMALLGRSAWWLPGWLDRTLPHADIEGAGLPSRGTGITDAAEAIRLRAGSGC